MKTTFQSSLAATILLLATPILLPAQTEAPDFELFDTENPEFKLYATEIPHLRIEEGTKLREVILLLEKDWGITINAVYQDEAGEAPVPKLDLKNVSLIDLLQVIETLTDVSTNVISNSTKTSPIVCFRAPKKRTSPLPVVLSATSPVNMNAPNPAQTSMLGTTSALQRTTGSSSSAATATAAEAEDLKPQSDGLTLLMRVFPLSNYDANPEDILDFVEQFLMLASNDEDDKVAAVRSLYHKGTNSLIMRGNISELDEIEEALEQLGGKRAVVVDPFAAPQRMRKRPSSDPHGAASGSDDSLDPFGDGGSSSRKPEDSKAAETPLNNAKKPKKEEPENDPFG